MIAFFANIFGYILNIIYNFVQNFNKIINASDIYKTTKNT